jgi:hypothetical protein
VASQKPDAAGDYHSSDTAVATTPNTVGNKSRVNAVAPEK